MTLRPWLQLVRLPALFTAFSNILAAQLIATGGRPDAGTLAALLAASGCLYLGGMALNDCCDIEVDRRERPGRPLPSGQITPRSAWSLALGLLVAGCLLAALAGSVALAVAVTLAVLIVLYDGALKSTWAGPWAMGGCRYLNWMLGLAGAGALVGATPWLLPLPVFAYIAALTWLSRGEVTGGAQGPVRACAAGLAGSALLFVVLAVTGVVTPLALAPVALALAWLLWRLADIGRRPEPARIQALMKTLILGVVAVDALLVLAAGPAWGALPVALLALPGAWLARWIYVT